LLEALQVEIPAEAFDLDLKDMAGAQMMASIIHEDYEGRPQPKISDHWAVVEEESAKPEQAKATTRRGRAAPEPEPEAKPARSSRRAAKAEAEAEPEPEAKAAPTRRGSAKPAAKAAAKTNGSADTISQADINDMSQEELDDVIAEFKLDVDLSEFKTLRRMRTAVVDAAETAEVLAD
jgi:flagellar biosynthesis GTPase FlhF